MGGTRPRGPQPGWRPTTARAQGILADVLARYAQHNREGTLPRGARGIFYDLRPGGMGNGVTYRKPDSAHPLSSFDKMTAHPAAVQEIVVMARRAGLIPEEWVADTRAPDPIRPYFNGSAAEVADSIADWASTAAGSFSMDPQGFQHQYVELWCEAADLGPRIAQTAEPYGVPVYSGGGFDGLKGKRRAAERAASRLPLPTVILHIGDRDPHGEGIMTALAEDVTAWWAADPGTGREVRRLGAEDGLGREEAVEAVLAKLDIRRLALTYEQAEELGLLDADGKAEADSIPVQTLDQMVRDALDELFRDDMTAEYLAEEARQRAGLPALIRDGLAGVLGGDDEEG